MTNDRGSTDPAGSGGPAAERLREQLERDLGEVPTENPPDFLSDEVESEGEDELDASEDLDTASGQNADAALDESEADADEGRD